MYSNEIYKDEIFDTFKVVKSTVRCATSGNSL
jgi:hypothetical protein